MFDTKRNHYVPKSYLESFNKNSELYVLLINKNKIYSVKKIKTENKQDNLYTIKEKIKKEIMQLCSFVIKANPLEHLILNYLYNFLNASFSKNININLKEYISDAQKEISKIQNEINLKDEILKTQEELFYPIYEYDFFTFLEKAEQNSNLLTNILNNPNYKYSYFDVEIYYFIKLFIIYSKIYSKRLITVLLDDIENDDEKIKQEEEYKQIYEQYIKFPEKNPDINSKDPVIDIVLYTINQYFRTTKYISKSINKITKLFINEQDVNNLVFLCIHMKTVLYSAQLLSKDYTIYLINNNTKKTFITSDSPSCLYYNQNNDITIIMPFKSDLAIVISNKKSHIAKKRKGVFNCENEKFISYINKIIIKHANFKVYGDKKSLNEFLKN